MSRWETSDQKIDRVLDEFDKLRVRDRRNMSFMLRVLLMMNTKLDAILKAVSADATRKGVVEFGKPRDKPVPAAPVKPKSK